MKKKTPKPTRKPRAPRKTLLERLVEALEKSHPGRVDHGRLGDGSGAWVNIKTGSKDTGGAFVLEIYFEGNCEDIYEIGLAKEVVQVVDQQTLFTTKPKPKEKKKES